MEQELFNGTPTETPSDDYNIAFGKVGFAGSWVISIQKFITWLSTKFVAIGTDQTITGQVTYATSPLVPDPTTPAGVVNLQTLLATAGTDKDIINVTDHISSASTDKIYLINTTSKDIICNMSSYVAGSKKETIFILKQGENRAIIQNGGISYTLSKGGFIKLRGDGVSSWVLTEDSRNFTINKTISANTEMSLINNCVFYVNTIIDETTTISLLAPSSSVLGITSEFVNKGLGTLEIIRSDSGAIDDVSTITITSKNKGVKIEENNGYYKTIYNTQQSASDVTYNSGTVKDALDLVNGNKVLCSNVTELIAELEKKGDVYIKLTNGISISDKTINLGTGSKFIENNLQLIIGGDNIINNNGNIIIACNVKIENNTTITCNTGFPSIFCDYVSNYVDYIISKLSLFGDIGFLPSNTTGIAYVFENDDNLVLWDVYFRNNIVQLCIKDISENTTMSNLIPYGYKIDSIVIEEKSGNAITTFKILADSLEIVNVSPSLTASSICLADSQGTIFPFYALQLKPYRTYTLNPDLNFTATSWNSGIVDIRLNLNKIL